jgi:hypothetical protein
VNQQLILIRFWKICSLLTSDLNTIKQEIENWIVNYLDIPSKYYSGLKPCPFAKKAWFEDKVKVVLGNSVKVLQEVDNWNGLHDLIIVIYDADSWNSESWIRSQNEKVSAKNLYLMAFNPSDEEPDDECLDPEEWGQITDDVYGMVFIQELSNLMYYTDLLKKQGYYKNVTDDFQSYVERRRLADGWNQKNNGQKDGHDEKGKEKGRCPSQINNG